ncbi:unnamed protein product [Cyprideis torosa]|uniref:Uncharacterized protein n=1 Tax=Cyprideis torosa TaxID=163714 RepID=A0A7R8ZUF1_9CRUS|nr:unnamed protein product [Cyprideis torosa]CAG0900459.1 unnamed protein product [Cyprideis torosa]
MTITEVVWYPFLGLTLHLEYHQSPTFRAIDVDIYVEKRFCCSGTKRRAWTCIREQGVFQSHFNVFHDFVFSGGRMDLKATNSGMTCEYCNDPTEADHTIRLKLERVCYTIVACAILHNICKPANDPDLEEDQDDVNEEEEAEVELVPANEAVRRQQGEILRNNVAEQLLNN